MKHFHGYNKTHTFFEGWYLKHQNDQSTLAVIPAYHIDERGCRSASIQVITSETSYYIPFPARDFYASADKFYVTIGTNSFSEKGIRLDIKTKDVTIKGQLSYSPFKKPRPIMGPFSMMPKMECCHEVLSMAHNVTGKIKVNNAVYSFVNGAGFIEKDRGSSFPRSYLWTQCSWYSGQRNSLMLAAAKIPFLGMHFDGCVCSILYQNRHYRLATYTGARILRLSPHDVIIRQGRKRLRVRIAGTNEKPLLAPDNGCMSRAITENPAGRVRMQLWDGHRLVFDTTNHRTSYEICLSEDS